MNDADKKMLKGILEKKSASIPLTKEEETFVEKTWNSLMDSKRTMSKKDWFVLTGEQVRTLQKKTKSLPEAENVTAGNEIPVKEEPKAEDPTRDAGIKDEVSGIEDDETEGKPKAGQPDKDGADEKPKEKPAYEEDRLAHITQNSAVKIGDYVVRDLVKGVDVGRVMSVSSKGGLVVLWKSTMTQTFETPTSVRKVYKAKVNKNDVKTEDEKISPPVKEDMGKDAAAKDNADEEELSEEEQKEALKLADQVIDLGKRVQKLEE